MFLKSYLRKINIKNTVFIYLISRFIFKITTKSIEINSFFDLVDYFVDVMGYFYLFFYFIYKLFLNKENYIKICEKYKGKFCLASNGLFLKERSKYILFYTFISFIYFIFIIKFYNGQKLLFLSLQFIYFAIFIIIKARDDNFCLKTNIL